MGVSGLHGMLRESSTQKAPTLERDLRVTDDPELDAQLRERVDELTSRELADYAHGLGLFPPEFAQGKNPPIALVWLPEMDDDDEGVLMWDAGDGDGLVCRSLIGGVRGDRAILGADDDLGECARAARSD